MSAPARPPTPPDLPRPIRFHVFQWIGVPLLLLAPPLLALAGVFGERYETVRGTDGRLTASVGYPTRLRHRLPGRITVEIQAPPGDSIDLAIDPAYADALSELQAIPDFDEAYRLRVPSEARRVVVLFRAELHGTHRGTLSLTSLAGDSVAIPLVTTIFP